jgi:5-(carboxyamino)imidazole ribonucleotide synthase
VAEAEALARRIADKLDYVGVLTLEFFAAAEGPIFNEMAPRVHNSGHWTMKARSPRSSRTTSRYLRPPFGRHLHGRAPRLMQNLIADDVDMWKDILSEPAAHLHLYGKGRRARAAKWAT